VEKGSVDLQSKENEMAPRSTSVYTVLFALGTLLWTRQEPLQGQTSPCLTAQPRAGNFIYGLRKQYSRVGADSIGWKANGIPYATGSAITLVSDSTTCAAALNAYNTTAASEGSTHTATQVYVARIGTSGYVVMTTQFAVGEWTVWYYFDNDWNLKTSVMG